MENQQGSTAKVGGRARGRWVWIGLALVLALLGAAWWAQSGKKAEQVVTEKGEQKTDPNRVTMGIEAQRNIKLSVERAETARVSETIQATGSVGANETRVAPIRPLARGRIEKVFVRLGDAVRKDQPLAVYDNIELGELIGQYMVGVAALEKAKSDAEVAKRSVDRAKNLVDLGAVAKAELERRSAEHASALSAIETQRAEMARVEEKFHRFGLTEAEIQKLEKSGSSHREFSQSTLRAPLSGVVIKYNVGEGQTVGTEDELFTIADLSIVWIQANIYERDIAAVRKGLTVPVAFGSYPGQTFNCLITYVGDVLDPKTRTARARCEVANPSGLLKLDMFATLLIPSPTGREAVMVPKAALQTVNDRSVVFVKVGETEFVRREVDTGAISGERLEVKTGLKPGELVVTTGSFQLKSILLRGQIGGEE